MAALKDKDYLTESDLMDMFTIGQTTVWRWTKQGLLPKPFFLGRRKFWKREDITAHIDKVATVEPS
tara:strand:- start:738 stop:935 length:198 start_codon:yes stop_codon:yes gene_type:complete